MKIEEAKDYVEENACEGYFENQVVMPKEEILALLDQIELDQPKPEVPKFLADWIEKYKEKRCRLSHALEHVFDDVELSLYIKQQEGDYTEIIAKAWLYGYTVEKEKLYTVVIPNPHEKQLSYVLMRQPNGNVIINVVHSSNLDLLKTDNDLQLTEQEIRKDFEWAWQWKKEVTE